MKKKKLTMIIALFIIAMNGAWGQNPQWDFYESIPNFKSISFEIKGNDVWSGYSLYSNGNYSSGSTGRGRLSMTIYDDYTVSLGFTSVMRFDQDNYRDSNIPVRIIGNGIIVWRNERMELNLQITESTTGGSDNVRSTVSTRLGEQTVHASYSMPSYSNSQTYSYILEYVGRRGLKLSGNNIVSQMTGSVDCINLSTDETWQRTVYYFTQLKLTERTFGFNYSEKSQSEMNAQTSDMYGKWQWNDERSVIYLESTTKDASLVIWNNEKKIEELKKELNKRIDEMEKDTTLSEDWKSFVIGGYNADIDQYKKNPIVWGFKLPTGAMGYKTEKAEGGDELTYLMITFDGGSEQSFSFAKNGFGFEHVQYDRFMGILKRDASILNQIKDKRIMIVSYKQNGMDKTAMFQLEGLEPIYNAITQ